MMQDEISQTTEFSASYDLGFVSLSGVSGDYENNNEYWSVTANKEIAGIEFCFTLIQIMKWTVPMLTKIKNI